MKSLPHLLVSSNVIITLLLPLLLLPTPTKSQYVCDIPTSGCSNGIFNQGKCECECIPPFCPDQNGDCTIASGGCENPWSDCTRGVNCPWWVNPLKGESCTTGPRVPDGYWSIFNTNEICCNKNFPYSTICNVAPVTTAPTKYPTIALPENDDFEIIPIKFDVSGLPNEIKMKELKVEMTTVLKRILLRLASRISGLKISNVEEKIVMTRHLLDYNEEEEEEPSDGINNLKWMNTKQQQKRRNLGQSATLYFNVYVVRDEDKKFGPLIISEIRDSYSEVLEQIQQFADTKYFGADLDMNWCTSQNGKYDLCVQEIKKPSSPTAGSFDVFGSSSGGDSGGLAGWAIGLITIFMLIIVCCGGYWIAVIFCGVTNCFKFDDEQRTTVLDKNMYFDDESQYTGAQQSRVLALRSRADDDSYTLNSYGDRTRRYNSRPRRDPTMYIPGQDELPDPDSDVLMLTDNSSRSGGSSTRRYYEDPPLKPKRDPTMYMDGLPEQYSVASSYKSQRDPTMYIMDGLPEQYSVASSYKSQRDSTMYVDDIGSKGGREGRPRRSYYDEKESKIEEVYTEDRGGIASIDDHQESFDNFGFKKSYMADYVDAASRGDASFITEEPSLGSRDAPSRAKKSRKGNKKSSKAYRQSMPDIGNEDLASQEERHAKSFYR